MVQFSVLKICAIIIKKNQQPSPCIGFRRKQKKKDLFETLVDRAKEQSLNTSAPVPWNAHTSRRRLDSRCMEKCVLVLIAARTDHVLWS